MEPVSGAARLPRNGCMDHAHFVIAFMAFQVVSAMAGSFTTRMSTGAPESLSALEHRLQESLLGALASLLFVASAVVGIVLLFRLADDIGWGLAIAAFIGSWFLAALLGNWLRGALPSGLGFTLPGLIALLMLPFFGAWAWFAS